MPDDTSKPESSDEAAVKEAAAMTAEILKFLGIVRVIFVDDQARPRDDFSEGDVVSSVENGQVDPGELARRVGPTVLDGILADEAGNGYDPETAASNLRSWWSGAGQEAQNVLLAAFRDLTHGEDAGASTDADAIAVEKVRTLLPKGVKYEALLPTEWVDVQERGTFVTRRGKRDRQPMTLVLFDRDLSKYQGFRDDQGEDMLAHLLKSEGGQHCYAALVSHFVDKTQETSHAKLMAEQRTLDDTRFTVISKARLVDDPVEFARRLRAMLLSSRLQRLSAEVAAAYVEAVATANSVLADLSPPALERAVLGSANLEGVWEPDVLLRLLEAQIRDSVRGRLRADSTLHELVRDLRTASGVRSVADAPGPDELRRMQRTEAYSEYHHLSSLRLPLEPGDILRVVPPAAPPTTWDRAEDETYLLVTEQDCDLHIRSNGRRNRSPERLSVVPVILGGEEGPAVFKLPWFCPTTGNEAFAILNRQRSVPALALDLAALGEHGVATIAVDAEPAPMLIPTWTKRHQHLRTEAGKVLADYAKLTDGVGPEAAEHVLMSLTLATTDTGIKVVADPVNKTLSFGLQRVCRLLPPWRTELLQQLSGLGQRVSYEGDLTKIPGPK